MSNAAGNGRLTSVMHIYKTLICFDCVDILQTNEMILENFQIAETRCMN